MSTYSLQILDFSVDPKHLAGPRAFIALKTYTTQSFKVKSGEQVEFQLLSPDCVTYNEFAYQADRLIKELETLKRKAKLFFEKQNQRKKKYSEDKAK